LPTEIRLPQLGKTMKDAVLLQYNVTLGESVKKGDVIFEIETDKATLEVESPVEGFVKHIFAEIGQTVNVDEPVLVLAGKDENVPEDFINRLEKQINKTETRQQSQSHPPEYVQTQNSASAPSAGFASLEETALGRTVPLSARQKIIGQKMLWSKRNIPCFYLHLDADVTGLVQLRKDLNKTADVPVSYNDFLIYALTRALKKFPVMTGSLQGQNIILPENINIALAVELPDGVAAPVLKNLEGKRLSQIAREKTRLVEKTEAGKLRFEDLEGACITISNLGNLGIESFIPIVIPGQCSILGVGKITDTCQTEATFTAGTEEKIVIRKKMSLTLAVDHRIANGTQASQFLDFLRKYLQEPENFIDRPPQTD